MKILKYAIFGIAILSPALASACFSNWGFNGTYGMMGYGGGMGTFMFVGGVVWTLVGILAVIWLWQHISKK